MDPIPQLPPPNPELTWRTLNAYRDGERTAAFYEACLTYAQTLWTKRLPARAILCLDRAFGAKLAANDPILQKYPLPYHAMAHILSKAESEDFLGNPRVHFQHYADRLGEPRKQQRKWRAWACWAIARTLRPEFPADPRHEVTEPSLDEISAQLLLHGHKDEAATWSKALRHTTL